jgi:hypothetical protein
MLALILIVSTAALVHAGAQVVTLWPLLPRNNRDFGLE